MKRKITALSMGLLVVFLLSSCTVSQGKEEELEKATKPEWKVGYTWIFKYTKPKAKGTITVSRKLTEKKDFEGTPCYVLADVKHRRKYYYTLDLNFRAFFLKGRLFSKYIPDIRSFDWPLIVGKKWKQQYIWKVLKEEGEVVVDATFEVTGIEEIKTPAGKFTTFKVVQWSSKIEGYAFQEWWYSPKVKWFVRQRTNWKYGTEELELKKYKIK